MAFLATTRAAVGERYHSIPAIGCASHSALDGKVRHESHDYDGADVSGTQELVEIGALERTDHALGDYELSLGGRHLGHEIDSVAPLDEGVMFGDVLANLGVTIDRVMARRIRNAYVNDQDPQGARRCQRESGAFDGQRIAPEHLWLRGRQETAGNGDILLEIDRQKCCSRLRERRIDH